MTPCAAGRTERGDVVKEKTQKAEGDPIDATREKEGPRLRRKTSNGNIAKVFRTQGPAEACNEGTLRGTKIIYRF